MTGKRRKSEKICVNPHEKNNLWKKSVGIHEICGTKIINKKNLCKSVKSVGLKQSMRKNLRHLRNLRDKLIFSEKKKPAEKKKIRGKKNKKASEIFRNLRLFIERRRRPTLPHCIAVPSAQVGLTSLFGMGRGGTPPQ